MKYIFTFLCLLASYGLQAQEDKIYQWPQDWLGSWQGQLEVRNAGKKAQLYPMQLEIAMTDTAGRWHWILTYGEGEGADVRPYLLIALDSLNTHFVVDERNSILLDQYLIGNHFISRFAVDSTLLIMDVHNQGDHLISTIFHGSLKEPRISGEEVTEVKEVASYPIGGMQRAILKKQ